ncbi:MAG: acylphosphatase [Kiloniellaceae bacterium]
MTTTVRVVVSGRVQGVWYRAWTEKQATALGLDGWVRNRRDGSVEAVFSGDAETVESMVQSLWEGPPLADVTAVERFEDRGQVGPGFYVKSTE